MAPACFSGIFVGYSFVAVLRSHCLAAVALVMSWALSHGSLCCCLFLAYPFWRCCAPLMAQPFIATGVAHPAPRALDMGFLVCLFVFFPPKFVVFLGVLDPVMTVHHVSFAPPSVLGCELFKERAF